MIIQKFDYLSPKITLYFRGKNKHSSIYSGIITIISYLLILTCIIYYILDLTEKKNPTVYFFNRYIDDVGIFSLNSSSIFHYLNLISTGRNKNITLDFSSITIYGITRSLESYLYNFKLAEAHHWVYDNCDPYDDSIQKYNNIIDKDVYAQSACIKKYYNPKERRYYNISESGFIWPTIEHGMANSNRTFYGIIVQKCSNNSLKSNCKNMEYIDSYFQRYAISLNFIDRYTDVLNYKEPFSKYMNSVTDSLTEGSTTILNNLNFNPSIIRTHNGFFMDNVIEDKSFSFALNEKNTVNNAGKNVIVAFFFWMQNTMIYNERHYKKVQEILSNIGGLGSFILLIGVFINSFVSHYVILIDTQDLVFNIEKINFGKKKEFKKIKTLIKEKESIYHNEVNIEFSNNDNTNYKIHSNKNIDKNSNYNIYNQTFSLHNSNYPLFMNDYNNNEYDNNNNQILNINKQTKKNKKRKYSYAPSAKSSKIFENYKKIEIINKLKPNSDGEIKKHDILNSFFEIKYNVDKSVFKPKKKLNLTWCNYFLYILLFKNKNSKIKFFENFRAQVLSEENFVQNNLDIYKLLEQCKIERIIPFENDKMKTKICWLLW